MEEVVWLHEYNRFGLLVRLDAFFSIVKIQNEDGCWDFTVVDNDDYDLWEERAIDYESDGGG